MKDEEIAEIIASEIYAATYSKTMFAFQLFVEKVVLPSNDIEGYTKDELKEYILKYLTDGNRIS